MTWSYSRQSSLRKCARQYAYSYLIASSTAKDPLRRAAYLRKQLQTLANWRGHLVHETLADRFSTDWLASRTLDPDALLEWAWARAERQLAFSVARRFREPDCVKSNEPDYLALRIHEDGGEVSESELAQLRVELATCFHNLATQDELLTELRRGVQHQSELTVHATIAGSRVVAKLDWVFLHEDGAPVVIDWKVVTSAASDYGMQLVLYAIAVAQLRQWPITRIDEIDLWEVNLLHGEATRHRLTAGAYADAENLVFTSARRMGALTPGGHEDLDLADLDIARTAKTCAMCSFVPLCAAQLVGEGRGGDAAVVQGKLAFV